MDIEQTIRKLKQRYPHGSLYHKIDDLIAANKDLLVGLIQLKAKANSLYKMPAELFLRSIGILSSHNYAGAAPASGPDGKQNDASLPAGPVHAVQDSYASANKIDNACSSSAEAGLPVKPAVLTKDDSDDIGVLGLESHIIKTLRARGYETVGSLMKCSDVKSISGIGKNNAERIEVALAQHLSVFDNVPVESLGLSPLTLDRLRKNKIKNANELADKKVWKSLGLSAPEILSCLSSYITAHRSDTAQTKESVIRLVEEPEPATGSASVTETVVTEGAEPVEGSSGYAAETEADDETPEESHSFSDDRLLALARQHSELFEAFTAERQMPYGLEHFCEFFRTLYVRQENRYIKSDHGQSYGDYLIRNGVIPHKPAAFWQSALINFLKENYLSCEGGMLAYSMNSYRYDPLRNLCCISTALYDGSDRVSNLRIRELYSCKLELQPVYCECNGCETVRLFSNGKVLGDLGKTLFRTTGIGAVLAPVLLSGCSKVNSIKLSNDDRPNVIIELQLY